MDEIESKIDTIKYYLDNYIFESEIEESLKQKISKLLNDVISCLNVLIDNKQMG